MLRLQRLQAIVQQLDELLTASMYFEHKTSYQEWLLQQQGAQKNTLAEKAADVKNIRSPNSSEIQ